MKEPNVSVVIQTIAAEKYLAECLELARAPTQSEAPHGRPAVS
jgi:hypothetical protein